MHGAYFLYARHLKSGVVYYFKTYSPSGELTTGKSTGCRSKGAARAYCEKLFKEGLLFQGINQSFSQYASHFFDECSIWMQDRIACGTEDRPAISNSYKKILRGHVKNYLVPFFGDIKMEKITPSEVKKFRLWMLEEKGLAPKTVNSAIGTFRTICNTALADGVINLDPLRGIKPLIEDKNSKDGFTMEQAVNIFRMKWEHEDSKTFSLVAAITGMRKSEIFAIREETLHEDYIDIKDQFHENELKPIKTKEARKIPICRELYELLKKECESHFTKFAFVIENDNRPNNELKKIIERAHYDMDKLSLHSWRHFANTYYLGKDLNPYKVASTIGHSTGVSSMQERYLNFHVEDFKDFYPAQSELFAMLHS